MPSDRHPAQVQRRIQHLRATLLDGRGPGAGQGEIALHTRHRPALGGRPPAEALEELAERTSIARREPEAIVDVIRQRRADLAATVGALVSTTRPRRLLTATARQLPVAAAGALLVLVIHRRRRRTRRTR